LAAPLSRSRCAPVAMGSVGDAYDNAMCESFFATLEWELLARRRFTSQTEAKMAVFSYIAEGRPKCQEVRALAVDAEVERLILEVLTPDRIALAVAALGEIEAETRTMGAR
jgi:hypothetical protein